MQIYHKMFYTSTLLKVGFCGTRLCEDYGFSPLHLETLANVQTVMKTQQWLVGRMKGSNMTRLIAYKLEDVRSQGGAIW